MSGNFKRRYPCTIQRLSCKQKNCIRPCNEGDTAIDAINAQQRYFDDLFDPFSRPYNRVNFVCHAKSTRITIPIADRGSGALGNVKKCRIQPDCNCPKDNNPNNNTINLFEAQERVFDNMFNPATNLYVRTNTVCRGYNCTTGCKLNA